MRANPRPAAPAPVGGNLTVASSNVLNYFNGDGLGGGFPTARGASSAAEFTRQRDKIISALTTMNVDVIGIIEMENDGNGPQSALQDLINGMNALAGAGTYAAIDSPNPGTDLIKNGIIYKPSSVTTVGPQVNDVDSAWDQARPPLAQTFQHNGTGEKFTFIVNHFTSKSCSGSDTGIDADMGDGQGCDNGQRQLQANRLLVFIQDRKTASGDPDVLAMGDYNAYGEEDPNFILEQDLSDTLMDGAGGLLSQSKIFVPMLDRYSFQFDAQFGELDHAFATKSMFIQISGATIWHINADEPTVIDYNTEFKTQDLYTPTAFRASDHDPAIVGLNLVSPTAADGIVDGGITDANGFPVAGAVVRLSGTQNRKTITDANGNYRFDDVETNGFYTVRPSRANYSFSPAERFFSQLGNKTEAIFTATPNAVIGVNAIDTAEYFVRQHYVDFLGREPDESGFNFWSDQILGCGGDPGCLERKRINVSAAYFLSIEFQQTGGLVDGLYRASYGRRPLYAEFMPDAGSIGQGVVVGRGNWEQQLAANKQTFVNGWVQRAAFQSAYGSLGDDAYVDTLISHTGVSYSQVERDGLVSGLASGNLTRAGVLLRIAEEQRFVSGKRNEMFVMMEYFGYLRRDPDASGFQFWLNKLNQFNGNFEQAEMVKAFIVSGEYRGRF